MTLAGLGIVIGAVIGVLGLPITLREFTRAARLRRALKDDVVIVAALPDGEAKDLMQQQIDEQVRRLYRVTHRSRSAQITVVYGLVLFTVGIGAVALQTAGVYTAQQINLVLTPVLVVAALQVAVTAVYQRRAKFSQLWQRGSAGDLEKRRPEPDEHDSA